MKQNIPFFAIIFLILILNTAFAYDRICLSKGESVPSESVKRYTCKVNQCLICVDDGLYPVHPNYCNEIQGCVKLNSSGNNYTIDKYPPIMVINSPISNKYYNSRAIEVAINLNEPGQIAFIDNIKRPNDISIISNIVTSYRQTLSFSDGINNITFRAVDSSGNKRYVNKIFYVDSTSPKIKSFLPIKGFTNGKFEVEFIEKNPKNLIISYGNYKSGYKNEGIDISSCIDLDDNHKCSFNINLSKYDNQEIYYWLDIIDLANNTVETKMYLLKVDSKSPVIVNDDILNIKDRFLTIKLNISEDNFLKAFYIDNNSVKNNREKTLCSNIKKRICIKKESFSIGEKNITIFIVDKAGNRLEKNIIFTI